MNIGKSVVIKGELNGSEDLTIEGQVEGKIELRQNVLTIGANGRIKAQVFAKSVIILGEVTGNVTATEKVDIRDNGSVDGDIAAPRVAIAEGAHFRGSIDMQKSGGKPAEHKVATPAGSGRPAGTGGRGGGNPPVHSNITGTLERVVHSGSCRIPADRARKPASTPRATGLERPGAYMLSDLLHWGGKRPDRPTCGSTPHAERRPGPLSKALPKFLSALTQQTSPVLIDFGPVIGTNVGIFGERLGCKLFIEDLFADIDRHTAPGRVEQLPAAIDTRFRHADASVDGVLCWDFFDFLAKPPARRSPGRSCGCCSPAAPSWASSARPRSNSALVHQVRDRRRHEPAAPPSSRHRRPQARPAEPRHHQDVRRPDRPDSFLLKSNTREILLRRTGAVDAKPAASPAS